MVLIDSSVWIEALRRTGRLETKLAVEALLDGYEAQWCSPVRLEVLGGARASERKTLGRFFAVIPYRPTTDDDWERGIALAWKLRDQGLTVPWLDVLIAAIAIYDGTRIYSVDEHFEKISALTELILYRPGYGGSYTPEDA